MAGRLSFFRACSKLAVRLSTPCVGLVQNPLEGVPTRCANIRKAAMLSRSLSFELFVCARARVCVCVCVCVCNSCL